MCLLMLACLYKDMIQNVHRSRETKMDLRPKNLFNFYNMKKIYNADAQNFVTSEEFCIYQKKMEASLIS